MKDSGKLIKVMIHAFDDEKFKKKSTSSPETITLPVNPESFNRSFRVNHNKQQGLGNQGTDSSYSATTPETFKLDFVLDGTNTIQGYKAIGDKPEVKDQLKILLKTVYDMNCKTHRPNFLQIQWADLMFQCVLSDLQLNYTLLKPNGDPLRIKISATFLKYLSQKERVARECKESPDLTHSRLVKAGDRLDNMTNNIYNNPKYVLQIAKANGLSTFRKITPGAQFVFPPLDKKERA